MENPLDVTIKSPLDITVSRGIVIWVDGEIGKTDLEKTHLIVWPEAGIVVHWPPDTTAEEAFITWVHRRKLYGPLSDPIKFPPGADTLICINDGTERPDAKEVYLIHWEAIDIIVPWPEGPTVREAMDAWIVENRY